MSEKLWKDYLFLTIEMGKCLDREDLALFSDLIDQRQMMQDLIDESTDGFAMRTEGKRLIEQIQQQNQRVQQHLTVLKNRSKHQQAVSTAYDAYASGFVGGWMDKKS